MDIPTAKRRQLRFLKGADAMHIMEFLNGLCISELNFVRTYIAASEHYPMKIKCRRHHGLLFTVNGTETYHFSDRTITAPPGSVLYIPRSESYVTTLASDESEVMVVDFELLGDSCRPFLICFTEQNSIKSCFTRIAMEWNRTDCAHIPECKSIFYRIVGLMCGQLRLFLPSDKFDIIAGSVEYLHDHYLDSDFRLEELSRIAGISHRYFELLFRRKYGVTPKEYVLAMKIELAKKLLLQDEILIRDIAIRLGYSDIYHFGKLFTDRTGYTPSEYRKNFH